MKYIRKSILETRLSSPVVGCAVQGNICLALSVSGTSEKWLIHWAEAGDMGEPSFTSPLVARVGRTPFWVTPTRTGEAQRDFACAIDLPDERDYPLSSASREKAIRTQVESRFVNVVETVESGAVQVAGPDGRHLAGFGAIQTKVDEDFKFWRKVGIREPHVASPAAAIANLYTQCCPAEVLERASCRIVIVDGCNERTSCLAVVMDGWRLIEAVEFQRIGGQPLDAVLIRGWIGYVRQKHPSLATNPVPLLIAASGPVQLQTGDALEPFVECETWNPFDASGSIAVSAGMELDDFAAEMDLSAVAFGMALQGGI